MSTACLAPCPGPVTNLNALALQRSVLQEEMKRKLYRCSSLKRLSCFRGCCSTSGSGITSSSTLIPRSLKSTATQQSLSIIMDILEERYPKKERSSLQKTRERVEHVLVDRQNSGNAEALVVSTNHDRIDGFEKKLDLLDSLQFGLGYTVLQKYTQEFMDEDAFELWSVMSALLFMTGFHPESIGMLLKRHPCLFANSVRDPDNLKLLFEWIKSHDLEEKDALRIIHRYPLILQTPVHKVLEPRLLYLCNAMHLERAVVVQGIVRHPELLSVESSWIQERIDYYFYLGLSTQDVQKLFVAQPSAFAVNIEKYLAPMSRMLQEYVFENKDDKLFVSVLVRSGLLSRSILTTRSRIDAWLNIGLTKADVRLALKRFPRFLLYPVTDSKYKRKLEFLEKEMNLSVKATIPAFPQFLSYSLENRIAPRVLVTKAITGSPPQLTTLAMGDTGYFKANKLNAITYVSVLQKLRETEKGRKWLTP